MEKIDREFLIKEISTRLPYGVKAQVFGWDEEKGEVAVPLKVYSINTDGYISLEYNHYDVESVYIEDCLLYLRPMSSMTEEECDMVEEILGDKCIFDFMNNGDIILKQGQFSQNKLVKLYDYYNSIHVDCRGLIEKGLAIEVTKENNPYE